MQELLNQVIVLALAAVPALYVADFAVKLHDRFATAKTEVEQDIPDVCISDDELMEELASVASSVAQESDEEFIERIRSRRQQPAVDEAAAVDDEISDAEKERIALQRDLELAAAEEVAEPVAVELTQAEMFKADRRRILANRTIRELKSLASESGVPRYSSLTKDQLITALA